MMRLPDVWTPEPWRQAWSQTRVGVDATGPRPYFRNSVKVVVPAAFLSIMPGALNGYVLTKWRLRGDTLIFGLMLLACFIPFQIIPIPMARAVGILGLSGTTSGLVLVHLIYGLGFTTLFFRNDYAALPTELNRAAQID